VLDTLRWGEGDVTKPHNRAQAPRHQAPSRGPRFTHFRVGWNRRSLATVLVHLLPTPTPIAQAPSTHTHPTHPAPINQRLEVTHSRGSFLLATPDPLTYCFLRCAPCAACRLASTIAPDEPHWQVVGRAVLGVKPRTSHTRSENHATRPNSQLRSFDQRGPSARAFQQRDVARLACDARVSKTLDTSTRKPR
jgi:hypothetical protein